MSEPCRHERETLDELTAVAVHGALGAAQLEIKALRATIVERDASIAQLATRLAADDQDAAIEALTAECAHTALSLIYRRERDEARERLEDVVAEYQKAGKAWDTQRARLNATIERLTYDRNHPYGEVVLDTCPDSCGGQSWTGVNTNYGRRWRCDTCNRIISRYVSDAIQAADDRRAL